MKKDRERIGSLGKKSLESAGENENEASAKKGKWWRGGQIVHCARSNKQKRRGEGE